MLRCPHCQEEKTGVTEEFKGMGAICGKCGGLSIVTDDLGLRRPTVDENAHYLACILVNAVGEEKAYEVVMGLKMARKARLN